MTPEAAASWKMLMDGNERFRNGRSNHYRYQTDFLEELATGQNPQAAVIACVDSRVAPEILFDQPMGSIFVSRVPGNVASDSAKWMLDIAVEEMKVPLVVILAHTECLAVGQIVRGVPAGSGGTLRMDIARAVHSAKMANPEDLYIASIKENARQTKRMLIDDSLVVRRAVNDCRVEIVTALYDVHSGLVEEVGAPEESSVR